MDTSHSLRRRSFILLLVLFHSSMLGLASKMDVSDDAKDIKTNRDRQRFLSNSNNSKQRSKEYVVCTNQEPDPGPMTRISCNKPGYVITKINFAEYGNPTGTCGHFGHGNCGAPFAFKLAEKNCLGKEKCVLLVTDEMFGPSNCKGAMFGPSNCKGAPTLAVQTTCTKA